MHNMTEQTTTILRTPSVIGTIHGCKSSNNPRRKYSHNTDIHNHANPQQFNPIREPTFEITKKEKKHALFRNPSTALRFPELKKIHESDLQAYASDHQAHNNTMNDSSTSTATRRDHNRSINSYSKESHHHHHQQQGRPRSTVSRQLQDFYREDPINGTIYLEPPPHGDRGSALLRGSLSNNGGGTGRSSAVRSPERRLHGSYSDLTLSRATAILYRSATSPVQDEMLTSASMGTLHANNNNEVHVPFVPCNPSQAKATIGTNTPDFAPRRASEYSENGPAMVTSQKVYITVDDPYDAHKGDKLAELEKSKSKRVSNRDFVPTHRANAGDRTKVDYYLNSADEHIKEYERQLTKERAAKNLNIFLESLSKEHLK